MKENRNHRFRFLLIFLIYMATAGTLYLNALDNGFHHDDRYIIVENRGLAHPEQLLSVLWRMDLAGSDKLHQAHYRPVVYASYMINYAIGGLNPVGYHLLNLLIHILTAFLVALVLDQMTGRWGIGALSGFLFLIHPFNAEAVNYVTARSSQLYAMFYLLSFYAYMRYRSPRPQIPLNPPIPSLNPPISPFIKGGDRGIYFWLALSLLSFVLSLLSKEMAATFPLTLFLYEWLIGPSTRWRDRLRSLWFPAAFILAVTISYVVLRKILVGVVYSPGDSPRLMNQLATQSVVVIRTIQMILWPSGLTIDHHVEVYKTFRTWPVVGACLLLSGFLGCCLWGIPSGNRRGRLYVFLLSWFFVALAPVMVIPLNAVLQENRAYLAMIGPLSIMVLGLFQILDWGKVRMPHIQRGIWTGIVPLSLIYATLTFQRNRVWQDEVSLWTDALQKNPGSSEGHLALGTAYHQQKNMELAIKEYQEALILKPNDYRAMGNLAQVYRQQGRYDLAIREYQRVIQIVPGEPEAHYGLGLTFEVAGQIDSAMKEYQMTLALNPQHEKALLRLRTIRR